MGRRGGRRRRGRRVVADPLIHGQSGHRDQSQLWRLAKGQVYLKKTLRSELIE